MSERVASAARPRPLRVAYVMSRFPKVTETFVANEILAVERLGVRVENYPLLRGSDPIAHPGADDLVGRAHYLPLLSASILASQLHFAIRRPRAYFGALGALIRGAWGSRWLLRGGLVTFAKVTHIARELVASGVDHVHCHFASHPAAAGFIIHRLAGIPYSFTAHGSDLHVDRHMLCAKVAEASFVVTISEYNRAEIARECGPAHLAKVRVIHCGVDTDVFRPSADTARRSAGSLGPGRPFTIVCIGTLHEVKGQTHLVEACRLLADAGVAFRCDLVGDGPDARMLQRQIAMSGLDGRVVLAGRRTRDEIVELLRSADALVAPSVPTRDGRREGIPVVLMEAMASCLPVVASAISGIPELVEQEKTGLLTPPGDAEALASALRRLHDEPELRRRLGSAARVKVEQEFDLYANAAQLVRLFAESAVR